MSADGNWKITINTPMGPQEVTANIATQGDSFTGHVDGRFGNADITGKVEGDKLSWSQNITNPMPLTLDFEATVAGDKMTGAVKFGAFGNGTLSGERA